jgi:predicted transcriptional regulator
MAVQKEVVVVDATTGEIYGPRPRKTKRLEPFYMTTQQASIELAKLKLTAMEYRILHYLQGIADYDNMAQTSQVFLAKELNTTEATISVSLKRLHELGVVHKVEHCGRWVFVIDQRVSTRGKVK